VTPNLAEEKSPIDLVMARPGDDESPHTLSGPPF